MRISRIIMDLNFAVLFAALGITLLEMSEASAVGIALHADSGNLLPYYAVAMGVTTIMIPAAIAGDFIAYFPIFYVRIFSATLLLYFGIRLMKSARRSMKFQRIGFPTSKLDDSGKSIAATAYSVGVVEAFEAAIVLVALYPENYDSTVLGLIIGIIFVVIAAYMLRNQIRKVKQGSVKVTVSALLLSFSLFWYIESVIVINDIFLIPIFVGVFLLVYFISTRNLPSRPTA